MTLKKLPNRTYPALGLSITDRAVKEFFAAPRCSKSDLEEIRDYFVQNGELRCIYCGSDHPKRWDHIHPVSKGGDTIKGNLVPACSSCDDSKQDRTLDEWFSSGSEKKPPTERHEAIRETISNCQSHFGYQPKPFLDKLTKEQHDIYDGFQQKLGELRDYLSQKGITTEGRTSASSARLPSLRNKTGT